ncbi:site-2 protease family protein [Thermoflexus sp.]|uniref:site-2 protease family protein n=1 Tax=Thermoflexus sp. TaxID=1969742 RepID=UPI0025CBD48D|nr:site-2 protease family protein [Thermoflexus sp.]MDW8181225.1 site-2 protease family protein [Anaerolineae bacterium]MCS6965100.1 site-2 protease family protein [Thermoflexus sp.]MCS7351766.1 site-2 protease family protein [Thermoflexus sp.]MCX7690551.1 site-2 protease family protein [Thermoflexus sp.]MDW8184837.1 site-2 protease family protein [Anaerolineae bacterium]
MPFARLSDPGYLLALAVIFLFALPLHELAHAWVAERLGDPTPRRYGRVTLNPMAHLDPIGALMLVLAGFGWARPVPVNPLYLRYGPRVGMALVGGAGPLTNLFLAGLGILAYRAALEVSALLNFVPVLQFLSAWIFINIGLAVFNMLPLPPLDGYRVLQGLLPPDLAYAYARLEAYGPLLLLLFLVLDRQLGLLWSVLQPFYGLAFRLMHL